MHPDKLLISPVVSHLNKTYEVSEKHYMKEYCCSFVGLWAIQGY